MGQIGRRVIDGSIDGSMGLFIRRIIPTVKVTKKKNNSSRNIHLMLSSYV